MSNLTGNVESGLGGMKEMPRTIDPPRTIFNGQLFAYAILHEEMILVKLHGEDDPITIHKNDLSFERYKQEYLNLAEAGQRDVTATKLRNERLLENGLPPEGVTPIKS